MIAYNTCLFTGTTCISFPKFIREIRGIRVFFNLPQIITNFHKFKIPTNSPLGEYVGTLLIGALGALQ